MAGKGTRPSLFFRLSLLLSGGLLGLGLALELWRRRKMAYDYVLNPRPDDVYLAAWPGTGAEVLMMMLHQLKTDGKVDLPHIETAVPPFEYCIQLDQCQALAEKPTPRFFRTNSHLKKLPRQGRFIVLLRRPEDVAEANVRSFILLAGSDEFRKQALGAFLAGRPRSFFEYVEAWWAERHNENVLVLYFEEVLEDLEGTARRVAEHCGLSVDADHIARAAANSHPDILAQKPELFDPRLRQISVSPGASFIRKGKAGGGKALFEGERGVRLEKRLRSLEARLEGTDDERFRRLVGS